MSGTRALAVLTARPRIYRAPRPGYLPWCVRLAWRGLPVQVSNFASHRGAVAYLDNLAAHLNIVIREATP